jgi:hypothetical protein
MRSYLEGLSATHSAAKLPGLFSVYVQHFTIHGWCQRYFTGQYSLPRGMGIVFCLAKMRLIQKRLGERGG